MKFVLIVSVLTTQSSFVDDRWIDASPPVADTVQWYIAPQGVWRIRTFAVDQDVHIWHVSGTSGEAAEALARESTRKHCADIIASERTFRSASGPADLIAQIAVKLREMAVEGN